MPPSPHPTPLPPPYADPVPADWFFVFSIGAIVVLVVGFWWLALWAVPLARRVFARALGMVGRATPPARPTDPDAPTREERETAADWPMRFGIGGREYPARPDPAPERTEPFDPADWPEPVTYHERVPHYAGADATPVSGVVSAVGTPSVCTEPITRDDLIAAAARVAMPDPARAMSLTPDQVMDLQDALTAAGLPAADQRKVLAYLDERSKPRPVRQGGVKGGLHPGCRQLFQQGWPNAACPPCRAKLVASKGLT